MCVNLTELDGHSGRDDFYFLQQQKTYSPQMMAQKSGRELTSNFHTEQILR